MGAFCVNWLFPTDIITGFNFCFKKKRLGSSEVVKCRINQLSNFALMTVQLRIFVSDPVSRNVASISVIFNAVGLDLIDLWDVK